MASDLKKLAFDQGGKVALVTEQLMLARIKSLAVTVLHSAVHTVHLHDSKQLAEESTKAFAARVRGTAASCELTKVCPTADCNTIAQCADSEVRNAFERTPYVVVLKFHVFILISKSFNFLSPLKRILRYLTKP